MTDDKEDLNYLSTCYGIDIYAETAHQIEKAESKGCPRRMFFKVDDEGFIYSTYERPDHIIEREDYDE